ncbi:hypothetical protein Bbelb_109010 [Branchiostoma belcheri]|nr:hypothetical protein Bbelb_109010 [Branchiostoma belcheri]
MGHPWKLMYAARTHLGKGLLCGRPYGGVAVIWHKSLGINALMTRCRRLEFLFQTESAGSVHPLVTWRDTTPVPMQGFALTPMQSRAGIPSSENTILQLETPSFSGENPVAYPRETRQDELRNDSNDWRLISAPETVIVYMPYVEGRIGRDLQFVSDEPVLRDSPDHPGNLGADTPRVHLGNQWKPAETSDFLASIHRYPRGKSPFSSGGTCK